MGLKQEVEASFGNQPDRRLPHPATAGLSWFETKFSRRSFINFAAAALGTLAVAGMPLRARAQAAAPAESPADVVNMNKEQLLSDVVTSWSTAAVKEEALGELFELTGMQLSSGFTDQDGNYSTLFQSMLVSIDPDGNPILRNLLTEEEQNGFDTHSVPPFSGDAAPIKGVFTVDPPDQIIQMTTALGRVFGLPDLKITGADRFGAGGYNSYRLGDESGDKLGLVKYTGGELAGTIRMAQLGNSAVQAKVVPEYVMLQPGELATGGGITPTPERTLSPAEQLLAENTRLVGSKPYNLGDRSITVEVRTGQDSPVYFGLQGSNSKDNPNPIAGVPDQLTDEATNMFNTTGQYRQVNHLTLVTLKPNDPLFNQLPMNKTYAPFAYNPEDGSPRINIADLAAELTEEKNLTFVIRPVIWEPNNQERIKGNKGGITEFLAGALINGGGQDGFSPFEFTNVQNKSIVAISANYGNIIQVYT